MATLKDTALGYEPKQTKNIADLDKVSVDLPIYNVTGQKDGKEFQYSYVELNGEKYRVPDAVVMQLKDILEARPDLEFFKVKKTGNGLQTKYTVIAL